MGGGLPAAIAARNRVWQRARRMAPAPIAYHHHERPEVVSVVAPQGLRVLEVGCAAGAMGALMLRSGAREVVGLEVHPGAAAEARTRLSAVCQTDLETLEELPYPDGYFDCITYADVLEHLREPEAVLARLRRYLAADGSIVCSIPNVRHESVLMPLLLDGSFTYRDEGVLDRTHLLFFTAREILALVDGAGFGVVGELRVSRTHPSRYLDAVAELVRNLGGDERRFREEATIVQYIFKARPRA
jgi:2-polyprenyl-3-methyl-5-hydroxy-6-metoxy-1,4-benzoquinol methylase